MTTYPKRLIEVDLPIRRISAHARREKSIRHGHISTLHIWWARRPLAACRAVICAALWPDPADEECPIGFRLEARHQMQQWTSHARQLLLGRESRPRFEAARQKPEMFDDPKELRGALLDFIADFANWDHSTVPEYLDTSRALTKAAHEALGGAPGTRPMVVDPFCGGGSIPLEALRVGADAFASDLNPVPVLLNKVVLEYIPKYGQRLADEVRKWGEWIKEEAEKELAKFYPKDPDGSTPIAYLWARTIQCEGPGCGAEVPLMRSLWLCKKATRSVAVQIVPNKDANRTEFQIIDKHGGGWANQGNPKVKIENPSFGGTVRLGSATCPLCGFTTPVTRIREQLLNRQGGAMDARLIAVVTDPPHGSGRSYRLPTDRDLKALAMASQTARMLANRRTGGLLEVPDEPTPPDGSGSLGGGYRTRKYGISNFGQFYTPRQLVLLTTLSRLVREVVTKTDAHSTDNGEMARAIQACLAIAVDRQVDRASSLCRWDVTRMTISNTFGRQALSMIWDFAESSPFSGATGDLDGALGWVFDVIDKGVSARLESGHAIAASATEHPLADDCAQALITDPPYYDSVPYADLSDFFLVWLKRMVPSLTAQRLEGGLAPKTLECVVDMQRDQDRAHFHRTMTRALAEARRVVLPSGVGIVVFAHKSTSGWEAQLQAIVDAGWIVTGSWPIDTELANRLRAQDSAALASSVHLVCRPRENPDGAVRADEIGDWRDVLQELPRRIHEWMPRLAEEGVVGADAIFACLGPALEIFSRYSRVEKASGEVVTLKEYLEQVWAAVAKEALALVFKDADTTGFEADARLTAMWLWTLNAGSSSAEAGGESEEGSDDEEESEAKVGKAKGGFALEYDAARKIAQGLGAHLEDLGSLVEVSGEQARLLPVGERARHLFGKDEGKVVTTRKKKEPQLDLFKVLEESTGGGTTFGETKVERHGETVLDRIHQSMILFAAGRGEALKRFLVEDGVGKDQRFWRLAQALSALYPSHTEEKRWVDGVLARKKGLGF